MAQPTITRISRTSTSTDPYWQGHTSGQANYDRGAISTTGTGIHLYAVDEGTTSTYTYAELMAALNSHADWGVVTATSGNENAPSRTFTLSYGVTDHTAIIAIRSGTLMHEVPGSTLIVCGNEVWFPVIGAPAQNDNVGAALADVGVSYQHANTGTDTTAYTGRHEITIGSVHLQSTTRLFQVSTYPDSGAAPNGGDQGSARPVDGGFPQKVGGGRTASSLKASLAFFAMADGQSCLITDNRLTVEFARGGARQDFDMCGSGLLEANFSIRKSSSTTGFAHNVMTNMNNNVILNVSEDFNIGGTDVLNEVSGAFEVFSIQPEEATHPYLGFTTRSNAPFTAINRVANGTGAQYFPALTGAGNFNNATNRTNIVLQAMPAAGIQYWQAQFDGSALADVCWIDPAVIFTSNNTPFNRVESTQNSRRYQLYFLRSVGINNQDSNSAPKSSRAYVVGNQRSATALAHDVTWMDTNIPAIRTHANGGTWSVRNTDRTGSGLEGVVGRGAHYLVDTALEYNTQGILEDDYTRYTDSSAPSNAGDNVSYLVHRGGINRYQQNQSLRSTAWNLTSNGASGVVYSNAVDDIPGVSDNMVDMHKDGLITRTTGLKLTITANSSFTVEMGQLTNVTAQDAAAMVGASLIGTSGRATITAATRVNATTVSLTATAGDAGITYEPTVNSTILWDSHSGFSWTVGTSGNRALTITLAASTTLNWTYSQLASIVLAKMEKVLDVKESQMGVENGVFGSGNDSTYGGSNIVTNTLLETMLDITSSGADKSFIRRNTTTGTTLDLLRVNYSVPSGSALNLNPDEFITLMNYGSSFTIPARVTHNGAYTDSTGTPNFIDITLPTGVATTDVTFAVAYQAFQPLQTYLSYQGFQTGNVNFDTNGTLLQTEWQAVTRPSAQGLDTILSTLPTSWDWTPSAAGSVQRIIVQGLLTNADHRTTLRDHINGTGQAIVVGITNDLSEWGIYEATEASLQGNAIAMNLRLLTSQGNPDATNINWYFDINAAAASIANTRDGGNWQIGATPTIISANNRNFLRILSTESNDQETNSDGVWYLSAVGGKIEPVRQMYTGQVPAGTSITILADSLRPASSVITKTGTITVVPYSIASPGSNSEVKTLLTEDTNYPNEQITSVNRLGLFINEYNSATDANRTRIDVGDALDSTMVAKYVAAYGTAAVSDIIRVSDANLLDAHWRIRYDGVSQIDFLKMDGLLPTTTASNANYFEVDPADSAARCFFNAPTYSAAEVQGLVEGAINEQTEDLTGLLSNVSLGIPV